MQEPDGEGEQGLYGHGRLLDHVAAPPDARQEARLGLQRAHRAPGQHAAQRGSRVVGDANGSASSDLLNVAEEDPNQGTLVHHSQYFENVKGHFFPRRVSERWVRRRRPGRGRECGAGGRTRRGRRPTPTISPRPPAGENRPSAPRSSTLTPKRTRR